VLPRAPGPGQDAAVIARTCLVLALALPAGAHAVALEDRLVERALLRAAAQLEAAPEGLRIARVVVDAEEIVGPDDPWPSILNIVHATTRGSTVRRELLLSEGDAWRDSLARESERNLRSLGLFALVRVVAVRGPEPGTVALLAAVRDLWSLRLNMDLTSVGAQLQYLRVRPTEQNVLGLGRSASLDLIRRLDTWTLGAAWLDPRLAGSRMQLSAAGAVVVNHSTGAYEGSNGSISLGRPLFSLSTEWAAGASAGWSARRVRVFRGTDVWQLPYPSADAPTARVPYVYDARSWSGGASLTRSFGRRFKTNASAGWLVYSRRYLPPDDPGPTAAQRDWLSRTRLPHSEDASCFTGSLQAYDASWRTLHDVSSFSIDEDWQVGYSAVVAARWAYPSLWTPEPFFETGTAVRYRWYSGGNVLGATAAATVRRTVPRASAGAWVNRRAAAELLEITPPAGPGRFVVRALVDARADDLDHASFLLGGDGGLRGLPAGALTGTSMFLMNVEYRTRAFEFRTLHAGAVLFWDAGSAWDAAPQVVHTIGAGLRILLPQFDVEPLRVDFGWTLNGRVGGAGDRFSTSYGQIEAFRPSFLSSPL